MSRRPVDELRRLIGERVGATRPQRVAVVGQEHEPVLARAVASDHADGRVIFVTPDADRLDAHAALAGGGPYDLMVDVAGGRGVERRWREQFLHLRAGGVHVARLGEHDPDGSWLERLRALGRSGELEPPASGRDKRPWPVRTDHALAEALAAVDVRDGFATTVNATAALAKIPEEKADRFLAERPDAGSVLARVPAEQLVPRFTVDHSPSDRAFELPATHDAPALSLRAYRDVSCHPRQVVVQGHVVLPDTFRHHGKRRPHNQQLVELTPWFVRSPAPPAAHLDGTYYYLDSQFRGHFGHALTEQVSRVWGWAAAKEELPDLKALVFERPRYPLAEWEYELLAAAGIPRQDVHVASAPVQVATLVGATPMFSMTSHIHPAIADTYQRVGDALAARASDRRWPDRVFCSRRGTKRACHNGDEVELRFRRAGFEVVYPEELPLADQIELVRRAEVIAGYAGSGMFQIAFTGRPKHVILVASESYTATNEYLISAVLGHRVDAVLCRPDTPRAGRFSVREFHSSYTFDPEREGVFLDQVLGSL